MGMSLKVVSNKLPQLIEQLPDACDAIVRKTTFDVGADARENSPFKTGHLRNSHHEEFPAPMTGEVDVSADYAVFVHDGARGRPGRPWLAEATMRGFPAFQDAFKRLEDIVK